MQNEEKYVNFSDIYKIKDETEQIQKTYELFHEEIRLNHSKAARVEFLTTVRYIEKYLNPGDRILHEVASDGVSELMEEKINALPEADYLQYLRYHEYCCEKPEFLGLSNHLLFVGEKI